MKYFLALFFAFVYSDPLLSQTYQLANSSIDTKISNNGIISLMSPFDVFNANIVRGGNFGRIDVSYRVPDGQWLSINKYNTVFSQNEDKSVSIIDNQPGMPLVMEERFSLVEKGIDLDINIEAAMEFPIEIGDLSINFPWKMPDGDNQENVFERGFVRHHFIAGDGSFIYFTRASGKGPFLMILPKQGTKFEYFTNDDGAYKVFIHSKMTGNASNKGTWRQPFTSKQLSKKKDSDFKVSYGVKFRWVDSLEDLRKLLYSEGLLDIRVIPGMTVPTDLEVQFSIHTKQDVKSITAEFPEKTKIEYLGKKQVDTYLYKATFKHLGENKLTINHGNSYHTILEFFVTEPLETLVKKRSDFIVNKQQHRDTTKWYNGLYSVYDMKEGILRGPDNTDGYNGWWGYVLASDDPGLCKAPYVAAKNVFFPNEEEIASVEYYLKNYVWGKLQRTDSELPYPYGVYGVPNWKVARDPLARAQSRSTLLDRMQVWRSYDYPHMVMLYYHMYQIAKKNPEKVHYLDAEGYLERAWQTAKAYYTYPLEIFGEYYETYKQGCYNELVIENLIADLIVEGRSEDAKWLRNEYEKKVKYFIYDDLYPYGSEYTFDRTAFESSYAFAKYGFTNEMKPDHNLWYDTNKKKWYSHPNVNKASAREFMERQNYANLSVRGWLENKYFLLGSDFTESSDHSLSYMAKMGGWSILDYGIHFAENPSNFLQIGYASYLSSWALMNTGTAESNYGFWAPGKENDGAMGWAFTSLKHGKTWIRKEVDRGAWYYDGEADLGNGAGIRMATSILTKDPLFGWVAYGAQLNQTKKDFYIFPKDGIRSRIALITDKLRIHIKLESDGFAKELPIKVSSKLDKVSFTIENRLGNSHTTELHIENYDHHKLKCSIDGKSLKIDSNGNGLYSINIPLSKANHEFIVNIN